VFGYIRRKVKKIPKKKPESKKRVSRSRAAWVYKVESEEKYQKEAGK
jgi:hypothetical protein